MYPGSFHNYRKAWQDPNWLNRHISKAAQILSLNLRYVHFSCVASPGRLSGGSERTG